MQTADLFSKKRLGTWGVIVFFLVAVGLFMLPRLLSAQFGLFDDPTTLATLHNQLTAGFHFEADPCAGRFRPMYWLYYMAIYVVAGQRPVWFFVANAGCLFVLLVGVYGYMRRMGGKPLHAWFIAMLVLLSGPMVENAYTLSKPELQQAVWMILLLLTTRLDTSAYRPRKKVAVWALASLFALLSCLAKETGAILPAIFLAWALMAWLLERGKASVTVSSRQWLLWTAAATVGVAAFFLLRSMAYSSSPLAQGYGSNFNFSPAYLLSKIKPWKDWLTRDDLYVLPLMILPLFWWACKRSLPFLQSSIEALIWMVVWLAVYIPWRFTVEYYLLPFGIGAAILTGNLVLNHLVMIRLSHKLIRISAAALLLISAFFFVLTIPNNVSNAGLQLVTDASNAAMLDYVAQRLPSGSVVLINIQQPNEYVSQARLQLAAVDKRSDLVFDYFHNQNLADESWSDVYVLLPKIKNQFYPSVRTGVDEFAALGWNQLLVEHFGTPGELVYETQHSFPYLTIKNTWLFCPVAKLFGYCDYIKSAVSRNTFAYGWQIYRLSKPNENYP